MKNVVDFPGTVKMWVEDDRIRFDLSDSALPKGVRISGPHTDSKVGKSLLILMTLERLKPLRADGIASSVAVLNDPNWVALGLDASAQVQIKRSEDRVVVEVKDAFEDEIVEVAWAVHNALRALGWNDLPLYSPEHLAPYLHLASHPDVTMTDDGKMLLAGQHSAITYSPQHYAYLTQVGSTTQLGGAMSVIGSISADGSLSGTPRLIVAMETGEPLHLMRKFIQSTRLDVTVVGKQEIFSPRGFYRAHSATAGTQIKLTHIEVQTLDGQDERSATPEDVAFVLEALQVAAQVRGEKSTYALALDSAQVAQRQLVHLIEQLAGKSPQEIAQALTDAGLVSTNSQTAGDALVTSYTPDENESPRLLRG